jgi:hypothetical protein
MYVLTEVEPTNHSSFLPIEWIPEKPQFFVWWTGTLGQAEWLITHSSALRRRAVAVKCPSTLAGVPNGLRPLFALEQPDLLISDAEGKPLLSIEITEQQEFGLNGQQRMARFWSAVASKVPSAYLLPIESYQIERASATDLRIFRERNTAKRQFLLDAAVLRDVNGESLWRRGVHSRADLLRDIKSAASTIPPKDLKAAQRFVRDHVDRSGDFAHLPAVSGEDYLKDIDGQLYKIYIRSPRVTTSMLLHWMNIASSVTPTYPFKLQSQSGWMFRTNGTLHTLEDTKDPHLSFRNLLPRPGTSEIFQRKLKRDELQLFIEMVNNVVSGTSVPSLGRESFTEPDLLFPKEVISEWRSRADSPEDIVTAGSSDLVCTAQTLDEVLSGLHYSASRRLESEIRSLVEHFKEFHIYKIRCNVTRSLADPYSGVIAVRDLLFCRQPDTTSLGDLTAFVRTAGLVFYVELREQGARSHTFLLKALSRVYRHLIPGGRISDPLDQLIAVADSVRAEQIPKHIRSHLVLSDLVIVNRIYGDREEAEVMVGIPHLVRSGGVRTTSPLIKSLTV